MTESFDRKFWAKVLGESFDRKFLFLLWPSGLGGLSGLGLGVGLGLGWGWRVGGLEVLFFALDWGRVGGARAGAGGCDGAGVGAGLGSESWRGLGGGGGWGPGGCWG